MYVFMCGYVCICTHMYTYISRNNCIPYTLANIRCSLELNVAVPRLYFHELR